jgi:hypothetical protein
MNTFREALDILAIILMNINDTISYALASKGIGRRRRSEDYRSVLAGDID